MHKIFLKFNLFFLAVFSTYAVFDATDCLNVSFNTTVSHKAFPFGFAVNKLHLKKNQCEIEINFHELFYFHKRWIIDVCRGPVHIKLGKRAVSIVKKQGSCPQDKSFCEEFHRIKKIVQDNGLIFAQGNKENLADDHGKVYCSYLLIEKYLREGTVLGSNTIDSNNFWKSRNTSPPPSLLDKQ